MFDLAYFDFLFISLNDLVDIFVIACLIYKVILWIKETRAWALFKGVIILLVAFSLASICNLNTIYWLISNAFNVGLLALIVLFQPEIRKALEQLGKGNFLDAFVKKNDNEQSISDASVNEIIKAAKFMAEKKTGALIVIEREVPLGDFEQTGILIDGIISKQLLINIFEDKTPLHDGAVIIRNNKIKAAACILPLSQNVKKHDFGTRHRAAIGASEVSDAYVIVVSEERGEISIAKSGKLIKNIDERKIRSIFASVNNKSVKRIKLWRNDKNAK